MARSFESENMRKDQLFAEWEKFLGDVHVQYKLSALGESAFEEIYEGLVQIRLLSRDSMGVLFEKSKSIRSVAINAGIQNFTELDDTMYMVLGRRRKKWWPIELVSVGSIVNAEQGGIHYSISPWLMPPSKVSEISPLFDVNRREIEIDA